MSIFGSNPVSAGSPDEEPSALEDGLEELRVEPDREPVEHSQDHREAQPEIEPPAAAPETDASGWVTLDAPDHSAQAEAVELSVDPEPEAEGAEASQALDLPSTIDRPEAPAVTGAVPPASDWDPETFSALLRDMLQDLTSSHDELMPDVQPVLDERDAVLSAIDDIQDTAAVEALLFDERWEFPPHITWLRHAASEISRLRVAELQSDESLANLSGLREVHLRGGVGSWTSTLEPSKRSGKRSRGSTAIEDASNARFGTMKLASAAAERGPAPLERLLRGFRRGLQLRQSARWMTRIVWLGIIAALGFAWSQGLFPNAEYGAGAAALLWIGQEFFLNPRLDRRHLERLQTRTREAIGDFYSARLIALLEMGVIRSQLGRMDES